MNSILTLLAIALTLLFSHPGFALEMGEISPPLVVDGWAAGDPVDLVSPEGVTVVTFMSSNCPACREAVPGLSRLSTTFRSDGIQFVGLTRESSRDFARYADELGDELTFPVALDDGAEIAWAFDVEYVPYTVVLAKDRTILWQGHPEEGLQGVLTQVASDEYSYADFMTAELNQEKAENLISVYFSLADELGEQMLAETVFDRILNLADNNSDFYLRFGVHLALNDHTEKSLELIGLALQDDSMRTAAVLDLYATILYGNGNYYAANNAIEQAFALEMSDETRAECEETREKIRAASLQQEI